MKPGGLGWKLRRLRTMSAGEVAWRVVQVASARLQSLGRGRVRRLPVPNGTPGTRWLPAEPPRLAAPQCVVVAADAVLAGRFDIFALRGAELGFPPDWLRDPRTGRQAPLVFGKTLNYRDERIVGDIKYLWEPSRHLELVTLAQAWCLTHENRYAEAARTLLESWIEQNPYPLGPHWTSSLEHAVRLVNWSVAWQLLQGAPAFEGATGKAWRRRWLDCAYLHQRFIAGHFSRHSSANNHLFGEYMGLYLATLTWPCWSESAEWSRLAHQGLQREALLQNADDGVNREQGIWYHHEVADMMLLCGLAARAAGQDFEPTYWQRLEAMLEFVASLMSVAGQMPMIGDADDAVMVRFSREPGFCAYRSLLASGAVLFGRAVLARKAGALDDKSRWLLGQDAEPAFGALCKAAVQPDLPRAFPQGGYWVLGDRLDEPDELRLVVDAGPLGYLSIAAHGHADALAFTLGAAGRELLVDPGTYAYHTQPQWRDYFKGTSAHNTVRVDGVDQSISGGAFMWLQHARCTLLNAQCGPEEDRFAAQHEGYCRLPDPVRHRREIVLEKHTHRITVTDTVEARGNHQVELFWHFAEDCDVYLEGQQVHARSGPVRLVMHMPQSPGWRPELVRGQEAPSLGWISRRFDEKVPTSTVVWRGCTAATARLVTQLQIVVQSP